jgi:hypothetical protein
LRSVQQQNYQNKGSKKGYFFSKNRRILATFMELTLQTIAGILAEQNK